MALIKSCLASSSAELTSLVSLFMTNGSVGSGAGYTKTNDYQSVAASGPNPVTSYGCSLARNDGTGEGSITSDHDCVCYVGNTSYNLTANTPQSIGAINTTVNAVFITY